MLALSTGTDAESFWQQSLHNGMLEHAPASSAVSFTGDINAAVAKLIQPKADGLEITFFETVNIGAGQYANNPWLMEMPDPVTRCSWGNYLAVPLSWDGVRRFVGLNDLEDGHHAELTIGGTIIPVSVVKQFGQKENTLAIALGFGRTNAGRCGNGVGVDVQPFLSYDQDGLLQYHASDVSLSDSRGKEKEFSCVQYHHTMGVKGIDKATEEEINADEAALVYNTYFGLVKQGYQGSLTERTVIRNAHLDDVEQFIHDLQHEREHHQHLNAQSLYPDYSERFTTGHHWGMHIDLNACTGCGACTVACMAENNVPVVGKKEVSRHHEMTWLRIDRYYYGDVENPNVVYQPLMCQHCDNAPCENVCPVNATNQSAEGLNQMAYNRCVGTRYCANNCPYKVRRFNWLDYNTADLWPANERGIDHGAEVPWAADNLTRMVINPDVTVRSRGVMEKCSFCVQRIQSGKLTAKMESRPLRDADVRSACQTACPTGAITFGDMNNAEGDLGKKLNSSLNYVVLEEVNTRPVVQYQALINNRDKEA
jgi:molybdopterin-containing oxidoreductase family iron-sulfur binding subunit